MTVVIYRNHAIGDGPMPVCQSFRRSSALKVQGKESNGVFGLPAAGSSLDRGENAATRAISAMQLDNQRPRENAC
jgi:hypothetical protein